jgi:hypothetical protein
MIKENYEEKEPIWKRIFIIFLAIGLLLLVTSYILASYPLFPIVASLSESKIAENETIDLGRFSIIFTEEAYEDLQKYYNKDPSVEMAVCLKGRIEKDYIIDEIYQPNIIEQTYNHVSFKPCSSDSIILLHSQPFRHCIASEQDLITLDKVKQRNENIIMVIMCEPNRFSVYE